MENLYKEKIYFIFVILERRIIYNYTEYGDSPSCIGEELDLVNQDVILQGFGIQPDETIGELLQVPLRILSNEECYESFVNESEYFARPQVKASVTSTLYDGITDQVLCSKITCNKADFTRDQRLKKCVSDKISCRAPPWVKEWPEKAICKGSNVPTNPITITRIFPHWPMEQI